MPPMTTEQRITYCFQRIQGLETSRALIIQCKIKQTEFLANPLGGGEEQTLAANIILHADEALIQIDNEKEALRRLAEHLSGLLAAFPRPQPTSG